jgi:ribosomal protein S18 acetylase RimI-like enzyme
MEITYQEEINLSATEFISVLERSTLAERRPVNELDRIQGMIDHADIMITARDGDTLVGIARSVSDFTFCTYLSDLAVDMKYQHLGIGKKLIAETYKLYPAAKLILLAAPAAQTYYPKIGMEHFEHCFFINNLDNFKL